ncbi:Fc.00g074170.m01.CDS01 [Cosmosporella sp. VM-42]
MHRKPFQPGSRQRPWRKVQQLEVTPSPAPPLGDLIETIAGDSLSGKGDTPKHVGITNARPIASYNWVDGSSPKIIIPGKPPKWTPLAKPCKLQPDDGEYYRDINSASFPDHPLEPAIISVMRMCPDPTSVDIFACGSTLGNLLRFARGEDQDRPFRMIVEVVGDTVHLIRRENTPKELIPGVKGYGHKFPEAYTTWDESVKPSKSHQRILRYRFENFDMMVRFEGDGYIAADGSEFLAGRPKTNGPNPDDDLHQLSALLLGGSVLEPKVSESPLRVVDGGDAIPQNAIFDLKTRSIYRRHLDVLGDQLPRLWISQIEKFVIGFHKYGLFEDIEVKAVKDDVKEWEEANQPSLLRLTTLLHRIIDLARKDEDGRIEIFSSSSESLEIRKPLPNVGAAFSDVVKAKWTSWLSEGRTTRSETDEDEKTQFKFKDSANPGDDSPFSEDSDSDEPDYTACDEECGYCGKCVH